MQLATTTVPLMQITVVRMLSHSWKHPAHTQLLVYTTCASCPAMCPPPLPLSPPPPPTCGPPVQVTWHSSLATVPDATPTIYLAHEFMDALPVHQFVRRGSSSRSSSSSRGGGGSGGADMIDSSSTGSSSSSSSSSSDASAWREVMVDVAEEGDPGPHHLRFVVSPSEWCHPGVTSVTLYRTTPAPCLHPTAFIHHTSLKLGLLPPAFMCPWRAHGPTCISPPPPPHTHSESPPHTHHTPHTTTPARPHPRHPAASAAPAGSTAATGQGGRHRPGGEGVGREGGKELCTGVW
jgi:hypothetical protein